MPSNAARRVNKCLEILCFKCRNHKEVTHEDQGYHSRWQEQPGSRGIRGSRTPSGPRGPRFGSPAI